MQTAMPEAVDGQQEQSFVFFTPPPTRAPAALGFLAGYSQRPTVRLYLSVAVKLFPLGD